MSAPGVAFNVYPGVAGPMSPDGTSHIVKLPSASVAGCVSGGIPGIGGIVEYEYDEPTHAYRSENRI